MFQFPACPPVRLWIHLTVTDSSSAGFPHSDINGSMPACRSPLLFAACHVLLRRMVPGHPPCALCSLIFVDSDPETNCSVKLFYPKLVFLNLCFAVQLSRCACPPVRLWIHLTVTGSSPAGFPHSDVYGSVPACGSP